MPRKSQPDSNLKSPVNATADKHYETKKKYPFLISQNLSYLCPFTNKRRKTMITIRFPDGREQEYEAGASAMEVAESISAGLAEMCCQLRSMARCAMRTDRLRKMPSWNY